MSDPVEGARATETEAARAGGSAVRAEAVRAEAVRAEAGGDGAVGDELARLIRLVGAWKQRARDEGWGDRLLLGRLAECGPRRATDLAADTLLDLSTVSRQIRSLVERGLVQRSPDPEDGRGTLLSPTESGLAAVERYRAHRDQKLAEALAGWPAPDRHDFARLLARFNDDFADRHVRPACTPPHAHGHTPGHGHGDPRGHGHDAAPHLRAAAPDATAGPGATATPDATALPGGTAPFSFRTTAEPVPRVRSRRTASEQ